MSELWVVRHGQASAGSSNYDQLSALGVEQCRTLGRYLAREGRGGFDAIYVGPRQRHRQTEEALLEVMGSVGSLARHELVELDEYPFLALFRSARDVLLRLPETRRAIERFEAGQARPADYRVLLEAVGRFWARDELALPAGVEPCEAFRARIDAAIAQMRRIGRGKRAIVSTSAGAVAAIAGHAMNLSAEAMIDLSFRVRNSSVTRLLFDERRISLLTFNELPHIEEARLETFF